MVGPPLTAPTPEDPSTEACCSGYNREVHRYSERWQDLLDFHDFRGCTAHPVPGHHFRSHLQHWPLEKLL
jgi:hypothetical protein